MSRDLFWLQLLTRTSPEFSCTEKDFNPREGGGTDVQSIQNDNIACRSKIHSTLLQRLFPVMLNTES